MDARFISVIIILLLNAYTSVAQALFDVSISGRIYFSEPQSVINNLNDIEPYIYEDSLYHVDVLNKTQRLILTFHPGDVANSVSYFDLSYKPDSIPNNHSYIEVTWPFYTNTGLYLGMSEESARSLLSVPFTVTFLGEYTQYSYQLYYYQTRTGEYVGEPNEFLESYNMPEYSETLIFKNGCLVNIMFGFEYP